jgi:3-oxoacyl-[acyl-carrier-protein] synthase II
MATKCEIVVTGLGVVSPIGIGKQPFWDALCEGRSGIRLLSPEVSGLPTAFGGEVVDFDPKNYVRPRKSLKVMSREIQLAYTAADLACADAQWDANPVAPERRGVLFGSDMIPCELPELTAAFQACLVDGKFDFDRWGAAALPTMYPLWMLKYLPNMPACHVAIAKDARGPNNSVILGDVSSLSAFAEAARVLERGQAEIMVVGGTGSRIHPANQPRLQVVGFSQRHEAPAEACRPFDADRNGLVPGEGAGALVLETRQGAEARCVPVLARVRGFASVFEPVRDGQRSQERAIQRAIVQSLADAELTASEIGYVIAQGLSTSQDDSVEAQAIHATLGDVPVAAPKSYFGYLGPASGILELILGVSSFCHGQVPPTLNYQTPDPCCPVQVIHGDLMPLEQRTVLVLSFTRHGQAVAVVMDGNE